MTLVDGEVTASEGTSAAMTETEISGEGSVAIPASVDAIVTRAVTTTVIGSALVLFASEMHTEHAATIGSGSGSGSAHGRDISGSQGATPSERCAVVGEMMSVTVPRVYVPSSCLDCPLCAKVSCLLLLCNDLQA